MNYFLMDYIYGDNLGNDLLSQKVCWSQNWSRQGFSSKVYTLTNLPGREATTGFSSEFCTPSGCSRSGTECVQPRFSTLACVVVCQKCLSAYAKRNPWFSWHKYSKFSRDKCTKSNKSENYKHHIKFIITFVWEVYIT